MKTKIKTVVEDHKDLLQTFETSSELTLWQFTILGILRINDEAYLNKILRRYGINRDKLIHFSALPKYG